MTRIATSNYAGDPSTTFQWATAGTDRFSRVNDLYALAQALESHDHTSGKGLAVGRVVNGLIDTLQLAAGAVTATKLGTDAVTALIIALDAVGALELADNSVDTAALQATSVTNAKIATDAIDARTIVAGAIGSAELASGAAVSNIGYTPANKTGDTFSGPVVADGLASTGGVSGSSLTVSGQVTSQVATGTAPLVVASTTEVANLNSSRVAGKVPTATPAAGALPLADGSGKLDSWISSAAVYAPLVGAVTMLATSALTAANTAGWLLCNGQAVSRTTHAALFTAIGTAFGTGDGSTTFNMPDLRDKFPIGVSGTKALGATGGAATADANHSHANTLGASSATGGSTWDEDDTGNGHNAISNDHGHNITGSVSTSTTLGSVATVPPYQAVNYIIYSGVAT